MRRRCSRLFLGVFVVIAPWLCSTACAQNLIESIIKARIIADGDVAGAPTDFLINLNVPRDNTPGLSLAAGNTIKITLPPEFIDEGTLQTETVFSSKTCTIGDFTCNTSVFVQGWPQRPIANVVPPVTLTSENTTGDPVYTLSVEKNADGSHTFIHTAIQDVGPGSPPPGPGIKQIHMILPGFTNPTTPGLYEIVVESETGEGGALQTGRANIDILPQIAPSINLNSMFDPMRRNTVYQEVAPGAEILPYEFYLWGADGGPLVGAEIVGDQLMQNGEVVGQLTITGPPGSEGQSLVSMEPSTLIVEPFFHQETGRLTAQFAPGDALGEYVTTIGLTDGTSERLVVNMVPEPATFLLAIPLAGLGVWAQRRLKS